MKTKRIAIDGMLAAMVAVLGYIAITTNNFKVSFESFPIFLAALMFGPIDGVAVAGVGTLIYQLLQYGVSPTTILWILPYCIAAFVLGLYAKKSNFKNTKKQMLVSIIVAEFIITLLNTGVMYIDAKMFGYWFPGFVTGSLVIRLIICAVKSVVLGIITPTVTTAVKRAI